MLSVHLKEKDNYGKGEIMSSNIDLSKKEEKILLNIMKKRPSLIWTAALLELNDLAKEPVETRVERILKNLTVKIKSKETFEDDKEELEDDDDGYSIF